MSFGGGGPARAPQEDTSAPSGPGLCRTLKAAQRLQAAQPAAGCVRCSSGFAAKNLERSLKPTAALTAAPARCSCSVDCCVYETSVSRPCTCIAARSLPYPLVHGPICSLPLLCLTPAFAQGWGAAHIFFAVVCMSWTAQVLLQLKLYVVADTLAQWYFRKSQPQLPWLQYPLCPAMMYSQSPSLCYQGGCRSHCPSALP